MKPIENVTASIFQQETMKDIVKPVSQKIGDLQVILQTFSILYYYYYF